MDAIAQVVEDKSHSSNKNDPIFAIFFDFSKAFDLVDNETLLEKYKTPPKMVNTVDRRVFIGQWERVVLNGYETNCKKK